MSFRSRLFHTLRNIKSVVDAPFLNSKLTKNAAVSDSGLQVLLERCKNDVELQRDVIKTYLLGESKSRKLLEGKIEWKKRVRWAILLLFCYGVPVYVAYQIGLLPIQKSNTDSAIGPRRFFSLYNSAVHRAEKSTVKFKDVLGCDEVKEELVNIVTFLKNPDDFRKIGATVPKGILLVGEPGVGKTLLAQAIAGEANVPFYHCSGGEFDEMFAGMGAAKIRDLFKTISKDIPCVLFVDEFDSLGRKRTSSPAHPYANQTLNQLLSEMDGFAKNNGVLVIGATNKPDILDKAVLRPGRFDTKVYVLAPDGDGRQQLFKFYLEKVKTEGDIDIERLSRLSVGFTGAMIKNLVNQAAILSVTKGEKAVQMEHMLEAHTKVQMGAERRISQIALDKKITAYHEAGHALATYFNPASDLDFKMITIVPRGHSLGHNAFMFKEDKYHRTMEQMLANLDTCMGGRVAEEIIFGKDRVTSGASSDLTSATDLARQMVKRFGMSNKAGLQVTDNPELDSSDRKNLLDGEVNRLLQESYERTTNILLDHRKELELLANELLEKQTLKYSEIEELLSPYLSASSK